MDITLQFLCEMAVTNFCWPRVALQTQEISQFAASRLLFSSNCSITGKLLGQKVGSRVLGWLKIGLPECESLLRYLKLVRVGDLCMLYQLAENMSYGYMALLYATGSS